LAAEIGYQNQTTEPSALNGLWYLTKIKAVVTGLSSGRVWYRSRRRTQDAAAILVVHPLVDRQTSTSGLVFVWARPQGGTFERSDLCRAAHLSK